MTFNDSVYMPVDAGGSMRGVALGGTFKTRDGKFYDSTGAFLVGELERLDNTPHPPLMATTWGRDIDLREDVTIADEVSSYTVASFGSSESLGQGYGPGYGGSWGGKDSNQIGGVSVDIAKVVHNLNLWYKEIKYTIPELESSAKLGRPIDQYKYDAMRMAYEMQVDQCVYVGSTEIGTTGLANATRVVTPPSGGVAASYVYALPNGASGSALFTKKSPDEILGDFNYMLTQVWKQSGNALMPNRILLPPAQFGYLSTAKISQAGNVSILKYIKENNIRNAAGEGGLEIYPAKWLVGAGSGGTLGTAGAYDRAVVYTKDKFRVRFPMTALQRTPIQYDSIYHKTTYYCRLGSIETPYPETIGYFDGL